LVRIAYQATNAAKGPGKCTLDRIIADSELLFCPNMLESEYAALADSRDPMDVIVAEDAQGLVDEH